MLSGGRLCVGLISCQEESNRVRCACVCEASIMRRSLPTRGVAPWNIYVHIFIFTNGFVSVRNEDWTRDVCLIPKEVFMK